MLVIPVTRVRDMKNSASLRKIWWGQHSKFRAIQRYSKNLSQKEKRGGGEHGSACL